MLTEQHTHEMGTTSEREIRNALEFGASREVNSKEGRAHAEGLLLASPNCSEAEKPQVELDRAVGETLIQHPPCQRSRTKLFFNVRIDNQFLD